jgi:hypothetical protein
MAPAIGPSTPQEQSLTTSSRRNRKTHIAQGVRQVYCPHRHNQNIGATHDLHHRLRRVQLAGQRPDSPNAAARDHPYRRRVCWPGAPAAALTHPDPRVPRGRPSAYLGLIQDLPAHTAAFSPCGRPHDLGPVPRRERARERTRSRITGLGGRRDQLRRRTGLLLLTLSCAVTPYKGGVPDGSDRCPGMSRSSLTRRAPTPVTRPTTAAVAPSQPR